MKKNMLICAAMLAVGTVSFGEELTEQENLVLDSQFIASNIVEEESTTGEREDFETAIEEAQKVIDEFNTEESIEDRWRFRSGLDYSGRPGISVTEEGENIGLPGDLDHGTKHNYEWTIARIGYQWDNGWDLDYQYRKKFFRNYQTEYFEGKSFEGKSRTDTEHNMYMTKALGTHNFFGKDWKLKTTFGFRFIEEGNIHYQDNGEEKLQTGFKQQRSLWEISGSSKLTDRLGLTLSNQLQYRSYDNNDKLDDGEKVHNNSAYQIRNYTKAIVNYKITNNLDFIFANQLYYRNLMGTSDGGGSNVDERWEWDYDYRLIHTNVITEEFKLITSLGVWGDYQFSRKGGDVKDHEKGEVELSTKLVHSVEINDVSVTTYGGLGYIHGYDTHDITTKGYSSIEISAGIGLDYRF